MTQANPIPKGTSIEDRLQELNIVLPTAAKPAANYVPYVVTNNHVVISGQLPLLNGAVEEQFKGRLGEKVSIEQGQQAARVCALNILAQLKDACGGDLERVTRCIRLGVFVSSAPDFTDQPKVGNGASDLIALVFGQKGQHARAAVGVNQLPLGVAVEVEAMFEIA